MDSDSYNAGAHEQVRTLGVISDTHGLLRPSALAALQGCDLILHAGDIGSAWVIDSLAAIAPTIAIRGNVDTALWARAYPEHCDLTINGTRLHMLHSRAELNAQDAEQRYDVVIFGHSHMPCTDRVGTVLYLNPGSAGPRRFSLPITLAVVDCADGAFNPRILTLPE